MSRQFLQELISFIQQKGFIWGPEPEIYGGVAGFYTYGPLGKMLKNNVENVIREVFVENDFFEVECPTIMPKKVWEASGHLKGFSDPVIECSKCKARFKVEQLLEELFPGKKIKDQKAFLANNKVKCPGCSVVLGSDIKEHDLMMKTHIGVGTEAYNRPETATTTYLPFVRYYEFFRKKLPFGVFQIGNAYRNEISPRQHVLRTREFTQAEAQLFLFKEQKNGFPKYKKVQNKKLPLMPWQYRQKNKGPEMISLKDALKKKFLKNEAYAYTLYLTYDACIRMGIPKSRMRFSQHSPDEKAFYAEDAWDVEAELNSFGWFEICGVHDRTDYDLKQHSKFSGTSLEALDDKNRKQFPHVLEIAFGTARPTFALLDIFYEKKKEGEGKTILRLPVNITPFKVGVFPLLRKPELVKLAREIYGDLRRDVACKYDETASIGKRYLRASEDGIPFVITIDFDSLKDKAVTVRDRDTEKQKRIKVNKLKESLVFLLEGGKFKDLK